MSQTERLDRQFDQYRLVQRIADGRMGEVFKAKSEGVEGFEKILCVKILYPRFAREDDFVDIVIEEAKRAVNLSHANVAQVMDLGQDEESGRYYIASEHINGFDLQTATSLAARSDRAWPKDLSLFIASEVAKALDYAHRRKDFNFDNLNLLHRDVAPSNILISYDGEVKVTDFGLARAFDTVPAGREDDPDRRYLYAPPEHARGADYSRAADIFSLGLVTYEMLTGSHPYRGDGMPMRESASNAQIPPLDQVIDVPRDLSNILDSMLAPKPANRLDNAGTAYERIVEFLFEENLRSDNRALGQLVTELRDLQPGSDASDADRFRDDLDEISHADVQSFYEKSDGEQVADAGNNDDLPDMPGGLDDSIRRARQGNGQAILMSGQFGRGRKYLPDRLAGVAADQSDIQSVFLHRSGDDRLRPWGLIADLVESLVHQSADHGIESSVDLSTLSLIDSLGGSDAVTRLLAEIWGLREYAGYEELLPPEQSIEDEVDELLQRWMRRIDRDDEVVVLMVDRIERADRCSLQLIRRMLDWIGNHSVVLIMSTKTEETMRTQFDIGQPDALRAIHVGASEATEHAEAASLPKSAASILLALSLLDRPVRRQALADALDLNVKSMGDDIDELLDRGLIRTPYPNSLLGASEGDISVPERFSLAELTELHHRLITFLESGAPTNAESFSRTSPIRLRLRAASRNREALRRETESYEDWLVRFGWEPIAADLYDRLSKNLSLFPVGDPRLQLEALARATDYSLQSGEITSARQTLEPLAARAGTSSFAALAELLRGQIFLIEDDLDAARQRLTHAAELADNHRAATLLPRAMLDLARLARRFGDVELTRQRTRRAIHLADLKWSHASAPSPHQPLSREWRAGLLTHSATFELVDGSLRTAHDHANKLAALADRYPAPSVRLKSDMVDGLLFFANGKKRIANHRFDRVTKRASDLSLDVLALQALLWQTRLASESERYDYLRSRAERLLQKAREVGASFFEQCAREYISLADVLAGRDIDGGLQQLRESLKRSKHRNIPRDIVRCHRHLVAVHESLADKNGELDAPDPDTHERHATQIASRWRL